MLVLVKGAGDLASGIACRLFRAGLQVIMTDLEQPTVIRRTVSFAQAMYDGIAMVEDIEGILVKNSLEAMIALEKGQIPVIVDPECEILAELSFDAVVDAILAKTNLNTNINQASIVVTVGPGFTAGVDCHATVETQRGHHLGRVILKGSASDNTGIPGVIGGYGIERVIYSPAAGVFTPVNKIGDLVKKGDVLGHVDGIPVLATIDGVLRGILQTGLTVPEHMKIGDIDPRAQVENCFTVSDKARAIGGGVLEALMHFYNKNQKEKNNG